MSDLVEVEVPAHRPAVRAGRDRGQRRPVHRLRLRVLSRASRLTPRRTRVPAPVSVTGAGTHSTREPAMTDTEHPARRDDRPRVHGQRPLAGLAHRPPLLRPARCAPRWRCWSAATPAAPPRPPPGSAGPRARPTGGPSIARDDIDLVDICTPGDTHAEIAIAALEAGKHVLCEKPLANTVAEAEAMTAAAERAHAHGVRAMVGFTYRRVPAIALARQLVAEGRIGEIRHVRAQYLQDWIADPEAPLSWRLDKAKAGSGALGRHRRPRHRPDPVHHRGPDHRAHRPAARPSSRSGRTPRATPPAASAAAAPAPSAARSPSTTRRRSSRRSPAARWASSRRPASPPVARTRSGSRSTARAAAWPSTSRT